MTEPEESRSHSEPRPVARSFAVLLVPFLAWLITTAVLTFVTDSRADVGFFRTTSTIIPTLLLALVFQGRFFSLPTLDTPDRFFAVEVFSILALGEGYALERVAEAAHPTRCGFTAGAIAAGFVAIAISAFTE